MSYNTIFKFFILKGEKMRKLLGVATMALTFGAILLFAQDTDAQIKQLEKELRLLELQKQVEQAKQGNTQSKNTQQQQNNGKSVSVNSKSACGNDYAFTSCYFGVELGVTLGSSATITVGNKTKKFSGIVESKDAGSYVALPVRLIGGYRWYFHDKMGLGINALLGYGGSLSESDIGVFSYVTITWGADLQYLVDFTRIFGMSVGLGFEMSHFIYSDAEVPVSSSTFAPAFTAGIGIHFNTENLKHRFGINYKYRLYKDKTIETSATKVLIKHGGVGLISVSYMYRF